MSQVDESSEIEKSNITVPLTIIVIGALIVFGINKLLTTDKDYKDLIYQVKSKTFGNRWVAAYELSKQIAAGKIKSSDIPWVYDELKEVFFNTKEVRTKKFVVMAISALQYSDAVSFLEEVAIKDSELSFFAIKGLSDLPKDSGINFSKIGELLEKTNDNGLKQAIIYLMAEHERTEFIPLLENLKSSKMNSIKYSSSISLLKLGSKKVMNEITEILNLEISGKNNKEILGMKFSILKIIEEERRSDYKEILVKLEKSEINIKVVGKIKDVLKVL